MYTELIQRAPLSNSAVVERQPSAPGLFDVIIPRSASAPPALFQRTASEPCSRNPGLATRLCAKALMTTSFVQQPLTAQNFSKRSEANSALARTPGFYKSLIIERLNIIATSHGFESSHPIYQPITQLQAAPAADSNSRRLISKLEQFLHTLNANYYPFQMASQSPAESFPVTLRENVASANQQLVALVRMLQQPQERFGLKMSCLVLQAKAQLFIASLEDLPTSATRLTALFKACALSEEALHFGDQIDSPQNPDRVIACLDTFAQAYSALGIALADDISRPITSEQFANLGDGLKKIHLLPTTSDIIAKNLPYKSRAQHALWSFDKAAQSLRIHDKHLVQKFGKTNCHRMLNHLILVDVLLKRNHLIQSTPGGSSIRMRKSEHLETILKYHRVLREQLIQLPDDESVFRSAVCCFTARGLSYINDQLDRQFKTELHYRGLSTMFNRANSIRFMDLAKNHFAKLENNPKFDAPTDWHDIINVDMPLYPNLVLHITVGPINLRSDQLVLDC